MVLFGIFAVLKQIWNDYEREIQVLWSHDAIRGV